MNDQIDIEIARLLRTTDCIHWEIIGHISSKFNLGWDKAEEIYNNFKFSDL